MHARAKELLPTVLLTLISIIQALAIELLWSRLGESPFLWAPGWGAILGWAQVAAMFLGILQVWLFYTSLVMRFRWLPSLRDSVLPFVIGILEFTLIDLLGPETLAAWFYLLAAIFAVATWESQAILWRARRDPENREFFEQLEGATFRDFISSIVVVSGLALFGLVVHVSGSQRWLALIGLVVANATLAYQIEVTRRYWERTMSAVAS